MPVIASLDLYNAFMSEFQRIFDQIDQNLLKSAFIAEQEWQLGAAIDMMAAASPLTCGSRCELRLRLLLLLLMWHMLLLWELKRLLLAKKL